jgi:hypothetical protein
VGEGINLKNPLTKIFIFMILFIFFGFVVSYYLNENREDSYDFGELKITKYPNESYILNVTSNVETLTIYQNSEWYATANFKG